MLVELKAVDSLYPMVGAVTLKPAIDLQQALADGGAVVERTVLNRLGLKVGDSLRLGEGSVTIRAEIEREPDRITNIFSLGPRVMIGTDTLPATELIQPGSQTRHHIRAVLPPETNVSVWISSLKERFEDAGWRIYGPDEAAPGVRRFIDRLTMFLSFAGLTALLVGGIGVANAVRGYLDGRIGTIATFKCLGAPRNLIFRIYLIQIGLLALAATAIGLIAGFGLPPLALNLLGDLLPVQPKFQIFAGPVALSVGFGLLTTLAFTVWPLSQAARIPAAHLFRRAIEPLSGRPGMAAALTALAAGIGLIALTTAVVSRPLFALWFAMGAVGSLLLLRIGAWALMRTAARMKHFRRTALKLAVANLHRPGAPTPSVVVSLGLGATVLVAVALIEGNMSRQIAGSLPDEAPAFFFLDIQPGQVNQFDRAVRSVDGADGLARHPLVRGRIVAINGTPVDQIKVAYDAEWAIRGDRALSYAAKPAEGTELVAGEWWPEDYKGPPQISLDANLAKGFGVGLGDTLTLNILGRPLTATITSLREIDWRSLRFDFAIIFSPGVLEGAPQTHVAAVRAPKSAEDAVEAAVTDAFSNISTIRVREALASAARIIEGVATAIRSSAAVTLLAGALVLAGAMAAGRRRRIRDAVILKVLGATRKDVATAFLIEHGVLGMATGIVAVAAGAASAWAVVSFVIRVPWTFLPWVAVLTAAGCVAVTLAFGFFETWRIMGHKAAPYLRNE